MARRRKSNSQAASTLQVGSHYRRNKKQYLIPILEIDIRLYKYLGSYIDLNFELVVWLYSKWLTVFISNINELYVLRKENVSHWRRWIFIAKV